MKKRILFGLLALATVLFFAVPASAVQLSVGEVLVKLTDHSNLYFDHDGDPLTPIAPRPLSGASPALGDENRAIFDLTSMWDVDTGDPEWFTGGSEELTGVFYDLVLVGITPLGPTALQLDFAPMGRNALPGGGLASCGGVVEIYLDTTPDFTADPGGVAGTGAPARDGGPGCEPRSVHGRSPCSMGRPVRESRRHLGQSVDRRTIRLPCHSR